MSGYEYILTMSKEQAHEVLNAVELLMRLKINQPENISRAVLNWGEGLSIDDWCKRRDDAEGYLRVAFKVLFPTLADVKKDKQWYRLYDLYQVLRKAFHDAEHPDTIGVDSGPVMCTAGEPMAKCEWRAKDD